MPVAPPLNSISTQTETSAPPVLPPTDSSAPHVTLHNASPAPRASPLPLISSPARLLAATSNTVSRV